MTDFDLRAVLELCKNSASNDDKESMLEDRITK